ncbi:MAG: hypothetical protein NT157_05845 [Candidatus Micrarchaeota archaeon]|nr:hypothetical protein [Candidatus Micrarchaeota archaeon]
MKESLRIIKTFVCKCGETYGLEISTDINVRYLALEGECGKCGEKLSITQDSVLKNRNIDSDTLGEALGESGHGESGYGSGSSESGGLEALEEEGNVMRQMDIFDEGV